MIYPNPYFNDGMDCTILYSLFTTPIANAHRKWIKWWKSNFNQIDLFHREPESNWKKNEKNFSHRGSLHKVFHFPNFGCVRERLFRFHGTTSLEVETFFVCLFSFSSPLEGRGERLLGGEWGWDLQMIYVAHKPVRPCSDRLLKWYRHTRREERKRLDSSGRPNREDVEFTPGQRYACSTIVKRPFHAQRSSLPLTLFSLLHLLLPLPLIPSLSQSHTLTCTQTHTHTFYTRFDRFNVRSSLHFLNTHIHKNSHLLSPYHTWRVSMLCWPLVGQGVILHHS